MVDLLEKMQSGPSSPLTPAPASGQVGATVVDVKNETLMEKIKPGYTVAAVNGIPVTGQPYTQVMKTVTTTTLVVASALIVWLCRLKPACEVCDKGSHNVLWVAHIGAIRTQLLKCSCGWQSVLS